MITCRHAAELASKAFDEPLSFRDRLTLWFHRLVCGVCRRFGKQLENVHRDAVSYFCELKPPLDATLSDGAKHRIIQHLHAHDAES